MKAEKEKTGFFHLIGSALTRNWGLKILALILAIIVYHSLKTGHESGSDTSNDRHLFQYR